MVDNVIEARGLLKLYGAQRAVDAIDLDIRRGEIFGLLGPNGAGKTTTILMMLGLTEISGGTVEVLGFDPVRQPLEVKRRVGYLPDAVGFYDHLTARENLRLHRAPARHPAVADRPAHHGGDGERAARRRGRQARRRPIRAACASGWASPRS